MHSVPRHLPKACTGNRGAGFFLMPERLVQKVPIFQKMQPRGVCLHESAGGVREKNINKIIVDLQLFSKNV